ncbi:unnamed protein product [Phytophthora fragariaefolia]|uniref:Unnamed protein product n=1 Tax=Phytophthora fragariaefolia TaxID=1490495 RepID=A0A9W6YN86_9STRA|nr:unnamed protein product [Phytophthora fragariaefolia]
MSDWKLGKRIARYLVGSKCLRLIMISHGTLEEPRKVIAYTDAGFAADRKSVTGGRRTVDDMAVSCACRKQSGVRLSTMKAVYTAASAMATELLGMRELVGKLGIEYSSPMPPRVDNQVELKPLDGEGSSSKAKHIDVRIKFVGAYTKSGVVKQERFEALGDEWSNRVWNIWCWDEDEMVVGCRTSYAWSIEVTSNQRVCHILRCPNRQALSRPKTVSPDSRTSLAARARLQAPSFCGDLGAFRNKPAPLAAIRVKPQLALPSVLEQVIKTC